MHHGRRQAQWTKACITHTCQSKQKPPTLHPELRTPGKPTKGRIEKICLLLAKSHSSPASLHSAYFVSLLCFSVKALISFLFVHTSLITWKRPESSEALRQTAIHCWHPLGNLPQEESIQIQTCAAIPMSVKGPEPWTLHRSAHVCLCAHRLAVQNGVCYVS